MVTDVYFGGVKVAEAQVTVQPGFVRFADPAKLLLSIPNLKDPDSIKIALETALASNSDRLCSVMNVSDCGTLSPETTGVILDEDRFRVDLFINPRLLKDISTVESGYLPAPEAKLSMTSSLGLSLSGSSSGPTSYNFQNRSIIAMRSARVRANTSYSSGLGLVADDFVVEVDQRNLRYLAGMFWAPGIDLTGQRRVIGAGVTTQLDTRADKDLLEGTPILLFLDRATRVEILADGRLLDSRVYQAGNNRIDTSSLPSGAYPLLLRIHQADGGIREEQRFFARNTQVAPVGRPIYFAFTGVLANTRRNHPFSPSDMLFYQAGTAHRLSAGVALDASIIGTQHKNMIEVGGYLLSSTARLRAALLVSAQGDKGALLQGGTYGNGFLSLNFDLRRISSSDGKPLFPQSFHGASFDFEVPRAAQLGAGSYTQASGSIGYRIASGFFGVTGMYRRDDGYQSDYSIGPSLSYPLLQKHGFQVLLQADAQWSRSNSAAYAGIRLLRASGGRALTASAGYATLRNNGDTGPRSARPIGSIAGELYHQATDRTEFNVGAAAERTADDANVRTHGALYTHFGTLRGDVLHHLGEVSSTHYGISMQTGIATDARSVVLGGRDLMQSALVVAVDGDDQDVDFDILVNEVVRGRVSAGGKQSIFLPPYRSYKVRLKPTNASPVSFNSDSTNFTLYPGTVQTLRWTAKRLVTLFGQAVASDGTPFADARVESEHGLGYTDEQGYFQVDIAVGDEVRLTRSTATLCRLTPDTNLLGRSYSSLGKVICK